LNKIGAAVIGVGRYGEVHARTYKNDPRTELVAIWSKSKERAQRIGEKYGCSYTTDLDNIAKDERIRIVSIATPDFAHTEPALKMIEAGKDVLIEKPMTTSTKEGREILNARDKMGIKLMVNFHNRWYPPITEAKRRLESEEIGDPVTIYARLSDRIEVATQWFSWASSSGPEWFLLPHIVDLVRWFSGRQRAEKIFALGTKGVLDRAGILCYDAVQAQINFERMFATVESAWIIPKGWRSLIDFQLNIVAEGGKIAIVGDEENIRVASSKFYTPFVLDPITEEEPIKHFMECVARDKEPACTGEDGLEVTRIIEGAINSIANEDIVDYRR
jgi:predicted dehydrogenase